jgi:tetratricopeptide (TPR) repeat protein
VLTPCNESDVASGSRQHGRKVSANRSRSNHSYSHSDAVLLIDDAYYRSQRANTASRALGSNRIDFRREPREASLFAFDNRQKIAMTIPTRLRCITTLLLLLSAAAVASPGLLGAQGGRGSGPLQEASRLDSQGATSQARTIFQRVIDTASAPAAKAAAQRAMAMSFAFDGDCANTVKYEETVIAYWRTREQAEPQNAFYQQGEMANEAARVCIDAGALDIAERYYRTGSELGLKEPEPKTHPRSLWDFRLTHALARLAARRGNAVEAKRYLAEARRILDADPTMAAQQERFYPYLAGYVALYTNDLATAETELTKALATEGNQNDPFMHCLLAMTYEKQGRAQDAKAIYEKAYSLATAHNPPAAFARPFARKKIGAP